MLKNEDYSSPAFAASAIVTTDRISLAAIQLRIKHGADAAATHRDVVQITFSIITFPIAAKMHDSGIFNLQLNTWPW